MTLRELMARARCALSGDARYSDETTLRYLDWLKSQHEDPGKMLDEWMSSWKPRGIDSSVAIRERMEADKNPRPSAASRLHATMMGHEDKPEPDWVREYLGVWVDDE